MIIVFKLFISLVGKICRKYTKKIQIHTQTTSQSQAISPYNFNSTQPSFVYIVDNYVAMEYLKSWDIKVL